MHLSSPAVLVLALSCLTGPASAFDQWNVTIERGLPVFSLSKGDGALRIVCDPDRVFGPKPNGVVILVLPVDKRAATVAFLAETGEQARLAVVDGRVAQADTEAAEWVKMVAILRSGGRFAVVSSRDSLSFETEPLPNLACE